MTEMNRYQPISTDIISFFLMHSFHMQIQIIFFSKSFFAFCTCKWSYVCMNANDMSM